VKAGKKCYQIIHGASEVCSNCGVKRVFDGAEVATHEVVVKKEDRERFLEVTVTPMRDKNGHVIAVLELVTDVTEMKRLHQKLDVYSHKLEELVEQRTAQLQQTQEKLVKSERFAAIGELAGMVGHDLRNPLTSIKGATYYLKTKCSDGLEETGKEMLSTIERSINYSNKIINDLLDYSREITLDFSQTTLRRLVDDSLQLIPIPENITISNATEDCQITVDHAKISRVVINLAKNAFDAMPKGGNLTIASRQANGNWELFFTDTGEGMNADTLGKLWTPLFTTKAKGMGFGLAICKRIVEAHGGKILVKSNIGQGTEFMVMIPFEPKHGHNVGGSGSFLVPLSLAEIKDDSSSGA
jgi:signal transduction histidine kinase